MNQILPFREYKKRARTLLKKHYGLFVFLCLAASVLGTGYSSSYLIFKSQVNQYITHGDESSVSNREMQLNEVLTTALENRQEAKQQADEMISKEKDRQPRYIGKHIQIGYSNGVLAQVANEAVTGAFLITVLSALISFVGSSSLALFLILLFGFALIFSFWMFFINVYKVIYSRMFLEGRIYKRVPLQRITFLMYVKKWRQASVTLLLRTVYYNLWMLTIIGGPIKHFSYFAVPYIVAENPGIRPGDAIRLSRRMMNGHKWECFKLCFTFIGWYLLNILTLGLSGIFYSNPYMEAALSEYYVSIRAMAKEKQIEGSELLTDRYLYELPSAKLLKKEYGKVEPYNEIINKKEPRLSAIISNFLGVYIFPGNYAEEKRLLQKKNRYLKLKYIIDGEEYASRLLPIPEVERRSILEYDQYDRKYSIWSLILFFVFFSFIGWVWEVTLHLVQFGEFVNRGTLHGPYLPIYGTGGVIVLLLLYKLRTKPVWEFTGAILVCGFVEYLSGYLLETMHHGEKWWNYNGYFLNIDGRVCAEGLFVFGIGGMIVVYFLAPLFDNLIEKLPVKHAVAASILLMLILGTDCLYSSVHPNTGEGITSFRTELFMPDWKRQKQLTFYV